MVRYCIGGVWHTYVYRRYRYLTQGQQYIFETRDLRGTRPDTYMYLIRNSDNTIVRRNDDYNGLASLLAYQPRVSGGYYLIIRGYARYSAGTCDVYQSTGGGAPTRIDNNVRFGGWPVSSHWKDDERIETTNAWGDTYLYLIHGNTMLRNDDGGAGFNSRITPGYQGWGLTVVGSYSRYTEGLASLCNFYQSYLDNPGTVDEDDPRIVISDDMVKFEIELKKQKASLEELPIKEQEERVKKLRDSILSAEDIKRFPPPKVTVPKEFTAALERYEGLLKEAEKKLEPLSLAERAAEMAKMEHQKREIFGNLVPQEEDSPTP